MADQNESPYEPLFMPTDRTSQQSFKNSIALNNGQASNPDGPPSVKELHPLESQTSLLHQSSSYLKQATSGFMRWQSRRAFWSAADQAEGPQPQSMRVSCSRTQLVLMHALKTIAGVSRRHPSVVLVPLLLACACIAGGLCGVIIVAQQSEQRARDDMATIARQESAALELLIDTGVLQPAAALAALAAEQPGMAALAAALPTVLPQLLQPAMTVSPLRQIVLAPFGTVNVSYSPPNASNGQPSKLAGSSYFAVGDAVWKVGGASGVEAMALAVQKRMPVVVPTIATGATSTNGAAVVLLLSYQPVYVAGVEAVETWGNTVSDDFANTICASGGCYDANSKTKLWGFTISVVSLTDLATSPESGLQGLADGGYKYRFAVLPSGTADWVQLAASVPAPRGRHGTAAVAVRLAGPRVGSTTAAAGTEGELLVDHDEGWQVSWEGPLIAVVVVVSLALSGFLFAMMFNYTRHVDMLKAMLPEKVIQVLGTGYNYYQHFDCVTVLYADVVRYTSAKPQQGDTVPTLEVVKLLNDVHSMYESIIKKYGLVRIRRSGESFLCVGGCPTPDDPVTVAVRVASCARDLLLATSRFRGSGGFRVQIRLGLHSGPAAAAVVGSKMPRFSLFGDVVDVAYYMEATSRTMAIHVSEKTSQLLTSANDPLLQLKPRRRMEIIGQGIMNTSWLRLDQLPDPARSVSNADAETEQGDQGATDAAEPT